MTTETNVSDVRRVRRVRRALRRQGLLLHRNQRTAYLELYADWLVIDAATRVILGSVDCPEDAITEFMPSTN